VSGYRAPDGSYTAAFPSPLRRLGAGAIDWTICFVVFLIASIVAGVFEVFPSTVVKLLAQLVVVGPVVAYFAFYWRTGSTLGMRALDIELVQSDTGRAPGLPRALPRACLAFLFAVAVNNVYTVFASDPLEEYSRFEEVLITISFVTAGSVLLAKAWLFVDERRQSLLDRLFGLLYLEELTFTEERSPWPWSRTGRV
jgi:uncharacterized RDD family membrane protein YckC